jgi:hypothetical protein
MKKTKVVVMNKNNARILINPDLSGVEGIAPHYWKFEGNKVVPMNQKEQIKRYEDILKNGADTTVNDLSKETIHYNVIHWGMAAAFTFGGLLVGVLSMGALYNYW